MFDYPNWVWFLLEVVFAPIFTALIAIFLEDKYGLTDKIRKIYHRLINSRTDYIFNIFYKSNVKIDLVKSIFLNEFRNKYDGKIKIYKDNIQTLEFQVNNSFVITLFKSPENQYGIQTSKIQTGLRDLSRELELLLKTFDKCQRKLNTDNKFDKVEASIKIYLPFKNGFSKIRLPKNVILKDYEIKLMHNEFSSIINITVGILEINSERKDDLDKIFRKII
jgi:hypothetical protein